MSNTGALLLDAEALYREMLRGVQQLINLRSSSEAHRECRLIGVTSGGAWLVQRMHKDLGLAGSPGTISSAMHRDDFARRGLSSSGQTVLPFDITDARVILVDDVLFTGRTIRAVINELFDYGRPADVQLAVLVDRGGRELPIQADFAAARIALAADQSLALARDAAGAFSFHVEA